MAKKSKTTKKKATKVNPVRGLFAHVRAWVLRAVLAGVLLVLALILLWSVVNPPTTFYMSQERYRLGSVDQHWVPLEEIAPVMARSVVAAEDVNFCLHWGFDLDAIRAAIDSGSGRGASTITQQVVKNVYLWHGRSWLRKAMEAVLTPAVELVWSKKRIVEVYLNVAEFDEGVFGVEAAARHYFGTGPEKLSAAQAARLAAILPSPKTRSAARPSASVRRRAAAIADGAATISKDARSACLKD